MLKTNLFLARPRMIITMISSMILACGREDRAATSDDSTGSDASAKYDGNDAALGCERPLSRCKDACVQTWSDASNCGACGNICASDFVCSRGSCRRTCDSGLTDCDSSCVNLQTDPSHCGSCKMACQFAQATAACQDAICVLDACDGGYADCNNDSADGCEIALSSAQDCGACGNICATPTRGTIECVSAGKEFTCSIASCDGGYGDCDADYSNGCETYTRNNVNHCGACGNVCSYANASAICTSGACAMSACNSGFRNCDSNPANGCETITSSDVTNCGSCGRACSVTNGTAGCVAGSCTVSACNSGYGDCDGAAWNGCETNLDTSVNHCGACRNECATPAHGTRACASGVCGIASCDIWYGYADCDSSPANGCEINTRTNVNHCGACGNVCPTPANGAPTCANGVCGIACNSGFRNCDNDPANGCESNINADASNCSYCGRVCSVANGTAGCVAGSCTISACNSGYGDCGPAWQSDDGCETNTNMNMNHCGVCGNVCPSRENASRSCTNGACGFTCVSGYADCDSSPANGCETYTRNNVNHCGACGNVCSYANASAICTSGACAMSACNSGFRNCDSNPANGCETITSSDVTNCGSCGRACSVTNGTAGCVAGSCTVSACNSGYGDCDGAAWNGCETNLDTSVNHCGACGNACPSRANASRSCTDGSCGSTCTTGYADCDNDPANGCETYTRYNVNHCGACGNVCPSVANSSPQCADSTCGFGCTGPYQDCDNAPANGCESNRQTDSNNCGRCGTTCAAGQACYRSSCEPLGYAFGANKTQGCSATLRSSCGTNMADFSEHNMVTSATVQECLAFPNLPNGARVRVSFDYGAAASSCWSSPRLTIFSNDIWRSWIAWFSFPGCTSAGSAWLDFTLPADQNTFLLEMYSGDWCSSVRVTNITQL